MHKYQYSIVRFVPSPIRGEFVNLGLIVGSDESGEWIIDVLSSKNRAAKMDVEGVLPSVTAELQRIQTQVESFSEPELLRTDVEISERWLRELSRNSQGVLQFSTPKAVLAETAFSAYQKLWPNLIVEHVPAIRSALSKATIVSRYCSALTARHLTSRNLKRRAKLQTARTHASIDVVIHNGVVKDITQCWSLQVKEAEDVLNDIKAWGWTIRNLRESGGTIKSNSTMIEVPRSVSVGVVYAIGDDPSLNQEALGVFNDEVVQAETVTVENVVSHAETAMRQLNAPHN